MDLSTYSPPVARDGRRKTGNAVKGPSRPGGTGAPGLASAGRKRGGEEELARGTRTVSQ